MTSPTKQTMAAALEAAVRHVPGVTTTFHTRGITSKAVEVGAQLLGAQPTDVPLVRWEHHPTEGSQVEAAIGVYAHAGAIETSHRVRAAISTLCSDHGYSSVKIRLTVVHIDDVPAAHDYHAPSPKDR